MKGKFEQILNAKKKKKKTINKKIKNKGERPPPLSPRRDF